MNLTEAFRALDALNEDTFSVSDDGIAKLAEFQDNDDLVDEVKVIDPDAETEEELLDSYVGKVILDCVVCHSKLYKDAEEVNLDEEGALANVEEECPYCYSNDGFKIIGQVSKYNASDDTEDVDGTTDAEDSTEVSDASEALTESIDELKEAPVATMERPMSGIGGTLSSVMTAHKNELAGVTDRRSALDFLSSVEPEVKNKNFLASTKDKIARLPDSRVAQFLYNIILKGDGMGTKMESIDEDELEEGIFGIKTKKEKEKEAKAKADREAKKQAQKERAEEEERARQQFVADSWARYDKTTRNAQAEYNRSRYNSIKGSNVSNTGRAGVHYSGGDYYSESLEESVNNVNVETDDSVVNVSTDESGKVTVTTEPNASPAVEGEEVLTPIDDETQSQIEGGVADDAEFVDADVDEFDEESFDELGESFLKETYTNVKSYKTSDVSSDGNKIVVEGVITFDSGAQKKTSFVFEAKDATKSGKVRFIGENVQITRGKKAFTLGGRIENNKFMTESFNYNYRAKDESGKSTRIYGTCRK